MTGNNVLLVFTGTMQEQETNTQAFLYLTFSLSPPLSYQENKL